MQQNQPCLHLKNEGMEGCRRGDSCSLHTGYYLCIVFSSCLNKHFNLRKGPGDSFLTVYQFGMLPRIAYHSDINTSSLRTQTHQETHSLKKSGVVWHCTLDASIAHPSVSVVNFRGLSLWGS